MATKKLRIVPGTVTLPHTISKKGISYVFQPDADLPEDYALALLKTYPNLYAEAEGTPDMSLYTVNEATKTKLLAEAIGQLSNEDQAKVLEFILNIQNGPKDNDSKELSEESLKKLTVPQLKEKAVTFGIDISAAGNKGEIIDAILKGTKKEDEQE